MAYNYQYMLSSKLPFVSVIVPCYNSQKNLKKSVFSLLRQDYPQDKFELIFIDNNSNDLTASLLKNPPLIALEEKATQSSYAARNRGIEMARGHILAFTDSDCAASPSWLSSGIAELLRANADLGGGRIQLVTPKTPSVLNYYESLNYYQNAFYIQTNNTAATANLFVKREVFARVGLFQEIPSSGDFEFCHRAGQQGFKLIYIPEALVYHPSRSFLELIKKKFRLGRGKTNYWKRSGKLHHNLIPLCVKSLFPLSIPTHRRVQVQQLKYPILLRFYYYFFNAINFISLLLYTMESIPNYHKIYPSIKKLK